jgi:hypothetical protein
MAVPTLISPSPNPASGVIGATVALYGTGLDTVTTVTVGGIAVSSFLQQSATSMLITAPNHANGAVFVFATNPDGMSNSVVFTYVPAYVPTGPGCARSAWLVLGSLVVPLENFTGGWFCESLDLGYPAVREVVSNKPSQDGVDDRTQYMGGRVVSANVHTVAGAGARIDAVASQFAPFMVPSARPILHYVLDRPGAPERTMVLRPSGYAWPVAGGQERQIQMQWLAADPAAVDPNLQTAISWSGASTSPGRLYNLTFDRAYPAGGGSRSSAVVKSYGDLPVRPKYRIYGPITQPVVSVSQDGTGSGVVYFLASFNVNAGHFVEVDSWNKTAVMDGDPAQSMVTYLDWQNSKWTPIQPMPPSTTGALVRLDGSSTSGVTQVQTIWQDRFLT